MTSNWEYRTASDWKNLITEWLNKHTPTTEQKRLVDSYELYLKRLDNKMISSRFKYETNGKLNLILHELIHG